MVRGMLVVSVVRDYCRKNNLPFANKVDQAIILGWCVEIVSLILICFFFLTIFFFSLCTPVHLFLFYFLLWLTLQLSPWLPEHATQLHGGMLVADDIMDQSTLRRGKKCWYVREDVEMDAINDAFVLESLCYVLLRKHFGLSEQYVYLADLFREVVFKTELGQMLDLLGQSGKQRNNGYHLTAFEDELYETIISYKTALYTFHLPITAAMIFCGSSAAAIEHTRSISLALGKKFQIQDDWLDTFGDPKVMGKSGTDIKDHKCTWITVQALKVVNEEQLQTLQKHYGEKNTESVDVVKKLFEELDLKQLYLAEEERSYKEILRLIDEAEDLEIPHSVLKGVLQKVCTRFCLFLPPTFLFYVIDDVAPLCFYSYFTRCDAAVLATLLTRFFPA